MANKCDHEITMSPISGTRCGNVPVQYALNFDSDASTYVVVGLRHYNDRRVDIIESFQTPEGVPYSRTLSTTIPWSRFLSSDRGNDSHVFVDAFLSGKSTAPVAGSYMLDTDYAAYVPLTNLYARATRTIKLCR